jgi:hypothetical protein
MIPHAVAHAPGRFNLDRADAPAKLKAVGADYAAVRSGKQCLNQQQIDQVRAREGCWTSVFPRGGWRCVCTRIRLALELEGRTWKDTGASRARWNCCAVPLYTASRSFWYALQTLGGCQLFAGDLATAESGAARCVSTYKEQCECVQAVLIDMVS